MLDLIVNFTPSHEGPRWGVEFPDGSRKYSHAIILDAPARCETIPDQPRDRGYLLVRGELEYAPDVSRIRSGENSLVGVLAAATGLSPGAVVEAALKEFAARVNGARR